MTTTYVLVHGTHSNAHHWAWVAQELTLLGHRALAVDLPGHGLDAYVPESFLRQDPAGMATEPSPTGKLTADDYADHVEDGVELSGAELAPVEVAALEEVGRRGLDDADAGPRDARVDPGGRGLGLRPRQPREASGNKARNERMNERTNEQMNQRMKEGTSNRWTSARHSIWSISRRTSSSNDFAQSSVSTTAFLPVRTTINSVTLWNQYSRGTV
jgi:hypothetical protein